MQGNLRTTRDCLIFRDNHEKAAFPLSARADRRPHTWLVQSAVRHRGGAILSHPSAGFRSTDFLLLMNEVMTDAVRHDNECHETPSRACDPAPRLAETAAPHDDAVIEAALVALARLMGRRTAQSCSRGERLSPSGPSIPPSHNAPAV